MSDNIRTELTEHVDNIARSLTWSAIAEEAIEDDTYATVTMDEDGHFFDEDGDELTADEAFHTANPHDAPAAEWLEGALEVSVHGKRDLFSDDWSWDRISVLVGFGGPNIWADWDGSRWHVHGHWGSEEVHRYMSGDELGVGEYLSETAEYGI